MISLLLVAAMGGLGSLVRFHLGGFVHSTANRASAAKSQFPYGTLFVNVIGSLVLGFTAGLVANERLPEIFYIATGAGFCGSLTTFSTLCVDLQRFIAEQRFILFAGNLMISIFGGLGAMWLGFAAARLIN